ncbi:MAG TPA: biotin transporter BioY [Phycisphaerae bacterium]|nr:biotin transporter BioY [Phycisphaerae bacterium]
MMHATLAGQFRPSEAGRAVAYDAAVCLAGSALIALSAQVAVPLWPVPITGQTLAVLLIGALLGPLRGAAAVGLYLLEGSAGLPVFAGGGAGAGHLLGPSGGYLAGFLPAAALTGFLAARGWDRRFGTTVAAMLLGTLTIYVPGVLWLAGFVGLPAAARGGMVVFLPGDAIKVLLAAFLLPAGWKLLNAARP